ncbi:uncharacterized protein LOC121997328 [Zingiber officinale]|uniref:Uncharacterized protein n=1 Tax=Zingiber officinale TaxID=94328 RepID=A0A8J5L4N9_ZINOF|nr:uncharacterized protein LOC121997328 [Zingiber officinale]KAG6500770.1 hypothetical protein ZIOFF_040625 [Zingiber officinale]
MSFARNGRKVFTPAPLTGFMLSNIPELNGSNFSDWHEQVLITLGCLDLDFCLQADEPSKPTDATSVEEKFLYEKWERSNRLSLMIIKSKIAKNIRTSIPESTNARKFLLSVEKKFVPKKVPALEKELGEIINDQYHTTYVKTVGSDHDFYHAIHEIIEKLNERKRAIQFRLPSKEELKNKYEEHRGARKEGEKLTREEFDKIAKDTLKIDKITWRKLALETIFFMFGAPIGAVVATRLIPGGTSLVLDDILAPAVTSLTAIVLAKANRI